MNTQIFSDAMSELNEKYIMEAATFTAKKKSTARIWLSRVACIFLATLFTGTAVLTFSVEARAAFFGWVQQQCETFYEYFFEGEPVAKDQSEYVLGWVPSGYVIEDSYVDAGGGSYVYFGADDNMITFIYSHATENASIFVEGAGYDIKDVIIDNAAGDLYISKNLKKANCIVWSKDDTLFCISAPLGAEELMKLAVNVQTKK